MKQHFVASNLGLCFLFFEYENITIIGNLNMRVENHYSSDFLQRYKYLFFSVSRVRKYSTRKMSNVLFYSLNNANKRLLVLYYAMLILYFSEWKLLNINDYY